MYVSQCPHVNPHRNICMGVDAHRCIMCVHSWHPSFLHGCCTAGIQASQQEKLVADTQPQAAPRLLALKVQSGSAPCWEGKSWALPPPGPSDQLLLPPRSHGTRFLACWHSPSSRLETFSIWLPEIIWQSTPHLTPRKTREGQGPALATQPVRSTARPPEAPFPKGKYKCSSDSDPYQLGGFGTVISAL